MGSIGVLNDPAAVDGRHQFNSNNVKASLNAIASMRGDIGADMNRMPASAFVMQTQSRNTLMVESAIHNANMAEEIANMTKSQILAQADVAALAHSNADSRTILNLLQ